MTPISYKEVEGGYEFKYDETQLAEFHKYGIEQGGNGFILKSYINNKSTFEGYGTIEAPLKQLTTMVLARCVPFDGEFNLDKIMSEPKPLFNKEDYKFIVLNSDLDM